MAKFTLYKLYPSSLTLCTYIHTLVIRLQIRHVAHVTLSRALTMGKKNTAQITLRYRE
jgi:hypothetical protein